MGADKAVLARRANISPHGLTWLDVMIGMTVYVSGFIGLDASRVERLA
jgi:hypothetical protein